MKSVNCFALKTAAVTAFLSVCGTGLMAANDPIAANNVLASLAGRWTGKAVMITSAGPQAAFKCIVTYLPAAGGGGLNQNLRCESDGFKLHAATQLRFEGQKVTGRWQDKINEVDGTVAGAVTPTGFEVQLSGKYFAAKMAVAGSQCDQSVKVMPTQSQVFRELAAELKKC